MTDLPGTNDQPVLSRVVTICNKRGLHARAAARFVTMAERFGASVDVLRDGQVISARSIMGLMMLGAATGTTITVEASGNEAVAAIDALDKLVSSGFGEED
jgi:phosphocarrier protein HPr